MAAKAHHGKAVAVAICRHAAATAQDAAAISRAEQSNELYRNDPLTWDELQLQAWHDGEPITWQVRHDRDAFKELWLLFENDEARFPLYPGETTEIAYSYTVSDIKWGQWFQRAVRLPTKQLIVRLDFPAELGLRCGAWKPP
jgi:hypothetical protein